MIWTKSSQEAELLRFIAKSPGRDDARLAFADWLEERGEEPLAALARFVRLQCELAKLSAQNPVRSDLEQQAAALRVAYRAKWESPFRAVGVGWGWVAWERGLPARVRMPLEAFLGSGGKLLRQLPPLALDLWGYGIGDDGVRFLAKSPHLANIAALNLWGDAIGDAGAAALAQSSHFANLAALNLWGNDIGDAGAAALAQSSHFENLALLDLSRNLIGDAGAQALARSPRLANLAALYLLGNDIHTLGAEAIADSPTFREEMRITIAGFEGNFADFRRRHGRHRSTGPGSD